MTEMTKVATKMKENVPIIIGHMEELADMNNSQIDNVVAELENIIHVVPHLHANYHGSADELEATAMHRILKKWTAGVG